MANSILFDDWQTRYAGAYKYRRRAYILSLICTGILLLVSLIGLFFEWAFIVLLAFSLVVLMSSWLEWLKIKNNHLIIKPNQIEITNRFSKTTIYEISIDNLVLELRHSFNLRSGGIILKFYDSKNNFICKYEDMLNGAVPFGVPKSNWERSVESLGIKIIDNEWIIKNK